MINWWLVSDEKKIGFELGKTGQNFNPKHLDLSIFESHHFGILYLLSQDPWVDYTAANYNKFRWKVSEFIWLSDELKLFLKQANDSELDMVNDINDGIQEFERNGGKLIGSKFYYDFKGPDFRPIDYVKICYGEKYLDDMCRFCYHRSEGLIMKDIEKFGLPNSDNEHDYFLITKNHKFAISLGKHGDAFDPKYSILDLFKPQPKSRDDNLLDDSAILAICDILFKHKPADELNEKDVSLCIYLKDKLKVFLAKHSDLEIIDERHPIWKKQFDDSKTNLITIHYNSHYGYFDHLKMNYGSLEFIRITALCKDFLSRKKV